MTAGSVNEDELAKARELYARMQLGRYPAPTGDEFDLFNSLATDVQWPKTWAADGALDLKTRCLCTISSLITSGKPQIHGHLRAALAIGVTRQQIGELIAHIAFYSGFPSCGNAMRAAKEVFAELDGKAE